MGTSSRKAQFPTVDSLIGGTSRWLILVQRSVCWPARPATGTSSPKYRGALHIYVSTAFLYLILWGTRSQWRLISASVMWSADLIRQTSHIATFSTNCTRHRQAGSWPVRCYHSPVWITSNWPPVTGTWFLISRMRFMPYKTDSRGPGTKPCGLPHIRRVMNDLLVHSIHAVSDQTGKTASSNERCHCCQISPVNTAARCHRQPYQMQLIGLKEPEHPRLHSLQHEECLTVCAAQWFQSTGSL